MPTDVFVHVKGKNSDSVFDMAETLFPGAVRLIRKGEREGEAGFVVSQISGTELGEKLSRLEAVGIKVLGSIRISDY